MDLLFIDVEILCLQIARSNKEGFLATCRDLFAAKLSGTLTRKMLAKGKKAVATIETITKLASRESSLSALVTSIVQCMPMRPVFATRATVDENGGKYLNEDDDPRTVGLKRAGIYTDPRLKLVALRFQG